MKRLEPNLLLALSTGAGLILLILTATLYGAGDSLLHNALLAIICGAVFVALNPLLMKVMKQPPRPPLVRAAVRNSLIWAGVLPIAVIIAAFVPVIRPGHDYGLLIIVAAIWFGLTAESALKARSQAG